LMLFVGNFDAFGVVLLEALSTHLLPTLQNPHRFQKYVFNQPVW